MPSMRIALAVSAVLVAVGIACGGADWLSSSQGSKTSTAAIALQDRLPGHYWRVRADAGCVGSMVVAPAAGTERWTGWGCSPETTAPGDLQPWPMFEGTAQLAPDGGFVVLGDVEGPRHRYRTFGAPAHLAGSFTDADHFDGTVTGWPVLPDGGPSAAVSFGLSLELADTAGCCAP